MELVANRPVVEGEVRRALTSQRSNTRNKVLLLRAAPQWREDVSEFSVDVNGTLVPVTVAACPTVLAVLDALSADRPEGHYLVVLTPVDSRDVGDSVLARALQPAIKPINRWDLVADAFGAKQVDGLLLGSKNAWIAEALIDAQPGGGWRRLTGTVLTYATALNRLAAIRLGVEEADGSPLDAAALLQWTTDAPAVTSFLALRDAERDGLTSWLTETVGPVAKAVFGMASSGRVPDAVPFGLVVAALYDSSGLAGGGAEDPGGLLTARVRADERFLGGKALPSGVLTALGEAAESLDIRWTDNGHALLAADLRRRAELILAELSGSDDDLRSLASRSRVLDAGLDARLVTLARALTTAAPTAYQKLTPLRPLGSPQRLAGIEDALRQVQDHARTRERAAELKAAEAAARLARWLAGPEEPAQTLSDAATRMLRSWGWADRALALLEHPDTSRVPGLAEAYGELFRSARARRVGLDMVFADRLATWTEAGGGSDPLGVENLLERIARPVAAKRLPVILVLDGMSVAAASELSEEIAVRGNWLEAGRREDGREPVVATVPSVTAISRTSLLTGTLQSGGQDEERAGFTQFWGRSSCALFHKADLVGDPGKALADEVRDAILDSETVVAIVLNTIDDTLDKGTAFPHWSVEAVKYLGPILDEARRAGRPVILTADHGHILDRGEPIHAAQSDSARYRTGTPGSGEILIHGPRVLGGEVVVAVDDRIHYTPRKAGYHGGPTPAEVVIPVITLLPSQSLLPTGWHEYDRAGHAPSWWSPSLARPEQPAKAQPSGRTQRPAKPRQAPTGKNAMAPEAPALFATSEITPADSDASATSLGSQVVVSPRMAAQRQLLRRPPADQSVAALIDALMVAGGSLTLIEAASAAGEPPVRMSGYLAQAIRLLNVDSYPVLQLKDGGKTVELSEHLLRQQFL